MLSNNLERTRANLGALVNFTESPELPKLNQVIVPATQKLKSYSDT